VSYSFNFIVRKTGMAEYTIYSDKGYAMHVLYRCHDNAEAYSMARAWGSSWGSVGIRIEDEQDEQRDRLPSKT
jgi:hypothetical protein